MLYIGTNYHPHDWSKERWKQDIALMKQAGMTTVRLGHLCWDSYEPQEGVYTFEWFDEVMDLINAYKKGEASMTVVDTRPKGRFDGVVPEPRPGLTCGHMPGSVNIPFSSVVDPEKNFQFRSRDELRQLFESQGIDIQRKEPIVFSWE